MRRISLSDTNWAIRMVGCWEKCIKSQLYFIFAPQKSAFRTSPLRQKDSINFGWYCGTVKRWNGWKKAQPYCGCHIKISTNLWFHFSPSRHLSKPPFLGEFGPPFWIKWGDDDKSHWIRKLISLDVLCWVKLSKCESHWWENVLYGSKRERKNPFHAELQPFFLSSLLDQSIKVY